MSEQELLDEPEDVAVDENSEALETTEEQVTGPVDDVNTGDSSDDAYKGLGSDKIRYYRRPQSHIVFGRGLGFDTRLQALSTNVKLRRLLESISFINKGLGLERIVVEEAARAVWTKDFIHFYERIKSKDQEHFRAIAASLIFVSIIKHRVSRFTVKQLMFGIDQKLFVKYYKALSVWFESRDKRWHLDFTDWKSYFEMAAAVRGIRVMSRSKQIFDLIEDMYDQLGFNFCMNCPALQARCIGKKQTTRMALHKINGVSFSINGPNFLSFRRAKKKQFYLYGLRWLSGRTKTSYLFGLS